MKELFIKRFQYYKELAEKTFDQISDEQFFWKYNEESNSIATLVKHLTGNMLSRWTNFLTADFEKSWRKRDSEFENDIQSKAEIMEMWVKGWQVLFDALNQIKEENWNDPIQIRGEKHTVLDAVLRQFAHYPYHIGQIIYIGKMLKNDDWKTLSTKKNQFPQFNKEKFKNLCSSETKKIHHPFVMQKVMKLGTITKFKNSDINHF